MLKAPDATPEYIIIAIIILIVFGRFLYKYMKNVVQDRNKAEKDKSYERRQWDSRGDKAFIPYVAKSVAGTWETEERRERFEADQAEREENMKKSQEKLLDLLDEREAYQASQKAKMAEKNAKAELAKRK